MNWILGDFRKDFLWLCLPGLIAFALARMIYPGYQPLQYLIFAFIVSGFLDSGHVYGTVWRTYFHPLERKRSSLYLFLPIALFLIFFCWLYFSIPYLGAVVIYATIFHNVRQFFGISKWYQKLNSQFSKASDYFLYLLCITPFAVFHFRKFPQKEFLYYSGENSFYYPDPFLTQICLYFYYLVVISWLIFEGYRLRKYGDWNRTLSVLVPGFVYGTSFIISKTEAQVIFPLVAAHGAAYFALSALALKRTQAKRFTSFTKALIGFSVIAVVFGSVEFIWNDSLTETATFWHATLATLFLTPLFCHYIFDMFIWKGDHPEANLVFAKSN